MISKFRVRCPCQLEEASTDDDGDYIVPRVSTDEELIFLIGKFGSVLVDLSNAIFRTQCINTTGISCATGLARRIAAI